LGFSQERELSGAMFDDLEVTHSLTKAYKDSVIKFHVKLLDDAISLDEAKRYYWFNEGDIKSTMGNFTGKLLHGKYEKFDRSGNLIQKGSFRYGLKDGVWNGWSKEGSMMSSVVWYKGFREGDFKEYYESGQISKQGSFKKNKLHGTLLTFDRNGMQVASVSYDKGVIKKSREPKKVKIKNSSADRPKKAKEKKIANDSTTRKAKRKSKKTTTVEKRAGASN
jgi:hypothetical protein